MNLKKLLHQEAISVSYKPPDLDAITSAGGRRIHRRRLATALGTVVAVVMVVAVASAAVLLNRPSPTPPPVVSNAAYPSWALETMIHDGPRSIEVGHRVNAFVRTATGFVVASQDDIYAVTAAGVEPIGRLDTAEYLEERIFVVNVDGTLVAWLDWSTPDRVTVRTYDPLTKQIRDVADMARSYLAVSLNALDGRTAYLTDHGAVYTLDLDTGQRLTANTATTIVQEVLAAADGVLAFRRVGPNEEKNIYVGRSVDEAPLMDTQVSDVEIAGTTGVALSPNGAWLSAAWVELAESSASSDPVLPLDRIVPVVVDTTTGQRFDLAPSLPTGLSIPVWWLGDSVIEVVSVDVAEYSATFYACHVPDGTCELAGQTGPTSSQTLLALPDGRWASVDDQQHG